jgi:type I restriction enzyme, R subunit
LVVDYIGVAQNLKNALGQYSKQDQGKTGINEAEAVAVMLEKYEVVRDLFRPDTKGGFDYRLALAADATAQERLSVMAGAIEWVLALQQADAAKETSEEGKKRAQRRYADAVWRYRRRSPSRRRVMKRPRSATKSASSRRSARRW